MPHRWQLLISVQPVELPVWRWIVVLVLLTEARLFWLAWAAAPLYVAWVALQIAGVL